MPRHDFPTAHHRLRRHDLAVRQVTPPEPNRHRAVRTLFDHYSDVLGACERADGHVKKVAGLGAEEGDAPGSGVASHRLPSG
jgi:hypothetical protein